MLMKITFICTGGTIDKDYASSAGTYNFEISEPAVNRILGNMALNLEYEVKSVLKKDSLDMTEDDRKRVYDACRRVENNKIIVTHGTDTMVKTAEKLASLKHKAIILVGASKPQKFYDSDAEFNIGAAIGAINILNKGVYIAMNGRILEWNNAKKSNGGKFETIK